MSLELGLLSCPGRGQIRLESVAHVLQSADNLARLGSVRAGERGFGLEESTNLALLIRAEEQLDGINGLLDLWGDPLLDALESCHELFIVYCDVAESLISNNLGERGDGIVHLLDSGDHVGLRGNKFLILLVAHRLSCRTSLRRSTVPYSFSQLEAKPKRRGKDATSSHKPSNSASLILPSLSTFVSPKRMASMP